MKKILVNMLWKILDRIFDRVQVNETFDEIMEWLKSFVKRMHLIFTDDDKKNGEQLKRLWEEERLPLAKVALNDVEDFIKSDKIPNENQGLAFDSIAILREVLNSAEDENASPSIKT